MKTKILSVHGVDEALFGLGLSHGATSGMTFKEFTANPELYQRMLARAAKNAPLDGGHNKFLESIEVWLEIDAPRFLWQEIDTYRVGVTKQSDSTMHTLMGTEGIAARLADSVELHDPTVPVQGMSIAQCSDIVAANQLLGEMFVTYQKLLELMAASTLPDSHKLQFVKSGLPEVFHNKRILKTNYKQLRNMISQRKNHRLWQWHEIIRTLRTLPHAGWLE
jgi:hypothetical protein